MDIPKTRDEARQRVHDLVEQYRSNAAAYARADSNYNETQVRTEFITPFLVAMGWDVFNKLAMPLDQREVIEEATVAVTQDEERLSKKPDYELRLARQRKFFVEAKKPAVHIDRDKKPAFQVRRYGFSASVPMSVLTNFHQLAIYDCIPTPKDSDEAAIARLNLYSFEEYDDRFDELYDKISREAVYSGGFDTTYRADITRQGTAQFDGYFLEQVRSWRQRLAESIHKKNAKLNAIELAYIVQLILSRLVFLRICEDREIEKYESLKNLGGEGTLEKFKALLTKADERYDSGLFRIIDDPSFDVDIPNEILFAIISELYYPQSPYTFAVVEANVLGEIYEQFLGEELVIDGDRLKIVPKPEVKESGGVVTTPQYVVEAIVERAMAPAIAGKSPEQLANFRTADISCGSGVFLLAAFNTLLAYHLEFYQKDPETYRGKTIIDAGAGRWRLMLEEKRRILLSCVYGVDIDSQAVEVARFSLLLKLIEDEQEADIESYVKGHGEPALPSLDDNIRCGNSLVSHATFTAFMPAPSGEVIKQVNPFTWETEFEEIFRVGGFDLILGNPPYIRIQNMVGYSPDEARFYQSDKSSFSVAGSNNFDKYALFIERGLSLLRDTGRLGYIVPHKFCTITAGRTVRRLISSGKHLEGLVHFGAQQVFGKKSSNYTCILGLSKPAKEKVKVEVVKNLARWRYGEAGTKTVRDAAEFGEEPWAFLGDDVGELFTKLRDGGKTVPLGDVADIFVGIQTSDDDVYIVHPTNETKSTVTFDDVDGSNWTIEKGILRPFLHDVSLEAFSRPVGNTYLIFPYTFVNTPARLVPYRAAKTQAVLIPPDEFEKRYPRAWAYLKAHETRLKQRNITGGAKGSIQWYQYGRSQSLTKFNTPKIILPALSLEPRYAYDASDVVVSGGGNGPYYLVRSKESSALSDYYLLAVLCHPLSEAKIRTLTSVFRGAYYSHGKQFIENTFVPLLVLTNNADKGKHDEIVELVKATIALHDEVAAARLPADKTALERRIAATRSSIEEKVSALFELTPAELAVIASVDVPA